MVANFSNSYARLPEHFFARLEPVPVARPRLVALNRPLAGELGLDLAGVDDEALAALFAGNTLPAGAEPISMAYAGHQFGGFVPQLGDGRAVLLGEVLDRTGQRRDIQLKGSGPTPFSRRGDGRAALGPVLREYLVSESMHALGIPTTRALAAVVTGETVVRETLLPGAVLTRVASSHIRVGTFQYFAARGDHPALRALAEHVIERHYPEARAAARPHLALLESVARRQAALVAAWMSVGFVHGVMNTDNMAVSGETIDYGPCAFLEAYDPAAVFSSIDDLGRYAYGNQPQAARWNLARLAESLLPLIDEDLERAAALATDVLAEFPAQYARAWLAAMRAKLGLALEHEGDAKLVERLLETMHAGRADFTLTFRGLCDAAEAARPGAGPRSLFADPVAFDRWATLWQARLAVEPLSPGARAAGMRRRNPLFIARNHRVHAALAAAVERGDFAPFLTLHAVVSRPYDEDPERAEFARPAAPRELVTRTFCGT